MAIYKISPTAQQDLIDIYVRGFREWGESKAEEYQLKLISSFRLLAENPAQLQRHELRPYVIFYRKFSYGVRIARVLYKNRAMEKYM